MQAACSFFIKKTLTIHSYRQYNNNTLYRLKGSKDVNLLSGMRLSFISLSIYVVLHHIFKLKNMVGPSIIFYIFFAVPYIFVMYWLVKQDKKKYVWGLLVVTVIAVIGIIVSQKASKVAMQNYQQHQIDAREIEEENRLDSLQKHK